jgi:carbamate kinase
VASGGALARAAALPDLPAIRTLLGSGAIVVCAGGGGVPVVDGAGLRKRDFPAGSMGPKIEAVCRFVEATGKPAAIGRLADAGALLAGDAGTLISPTG